MLSFISVEYLSQNTTVTEELGLRYCSLGKKHHAPHRLYKIFCSLYSCCASIKYVPVDSFSQRYRYICRVKTKIIMSAVFCLIILTYLRNKLQSLDCLSIFFPDAGQSGIRPRNTAFLLINATHRLLLYLTSAAFQSRMIYLFYAALSVLLTAAGCGSRCCDFHQ